MTILKKNLGSRHQQLKDTIAAERFAKFTEIVNSGLPTVALILLVFAAACSLLLSLQTDRNVFGYRPVHQIISIIIFVAVLSFAAAVYIYRYNYRLVKSPLRAVAAAGLFLILLAITTFSTFFPGSMYIAVAAAVTCSIILTIAHSQRFAIVMGMFYAMLACLAAGLETDFGLFLTMTAGVVSSSFLLREIRTRIKP